METTIKKHVDHWLRSTRQRTDATLESTCCCMEDQFGLICGNCINSCDSPGMIVKPRETDTNWHQLY